MNVREINQKSSQNLEIREFPRNYCPIITISRDNREDKSNDTSR